jgi:hypothetical protein
VGGPTDIPHLDIANVLTTGYSVVSLSDAFTDRPNNEMPHQWDYCDWWAWAEDAVQP